MSAPSFSSFPPSFSSFPDLESGPSDNLSSESKKAGKEKTKKKHHDEPRKSRRTSKERETKHDSGHRKSRPTKEHTCEDSAHTDSKGTEPSKAKVLFYSDYKGDILNVQYGGPHSGDIPKYRMVSGGRNVLGLPESLIVLRRRGRGAEVGLRTLQKTASLSTSASRILLSKPPSRRLVPSSRRDTYQEVDGVITFSSRKTPTGADPSYKSIPKNDVESSENSSSSESEDDLSSEEDSDTPTLTAHQETLKALQQEVEAQPDAGDKWLSLLNQTVSTIPITSKNATKARSEISVSILARAISASPQNIRNRSLRLSYLRAGEEVWHETKVKAEWEEALKVEDTELQVEWLEWKIRTGNGGIDGVVDAAVRVLDGIGSKSEIAKVRVLYRVAVVIRSAGYTERAFAMFQAQAELSFNLPPALAKLPFQTQLTELEEFWESEYPRIGEPGAKGWNSWYSSKPDERFQTVSSQVKPQNVADLDMYRQWAKQEILFDRSSFLPQRSDSNSTDPYSMVLFSDVRPILLDLKTRDAKHAFRMAWLSFCGLNLPGFHLSDTDEGNWDDRWNLHYLTTPQNLERIFPPNEDRRIVLNDAVAGVVIGRERFYNSPFGPIRCWGKEVSRPLDLASSEPGKVLKRGIWSTEDISHLDEEFVRRLFAGMRVLKDDLEWDLLALAFELSINPKSATKLSKFFLSTNQDSLGLWGAHCQLERLRGRIDDARKVYQTVLVASKLNNMRKEASQLWWNWAEMEWLSNNNQQALEVILRSVGLEGSSTRITILRAKRSLEELAEATRQTNGWKDQEAWIELRALVEIIEGHDPRAAISVFDKYLSSETDKSSAESLMTASLVMVYSYGVILRNTMPPAVLRERAHQAFQQYPSNSIILGILLAAEKGQGVWGRVRSMLGGNDGKVKDVARRAEEVWMAGWERGRWMSEVERTRNGLAAAVEHERVFDRHELNGLGDAMAERGIRLHQGLEEALEGVDMEEAPQTSSDEDMEDEIEYNAHELRRLKPY
ncbi:Nuclear exosome regulator NRDE2 [Psilocybe cubensis]|uniref:Nuclear exosome regulator NRDE2 n=1 Tax=Psilocybe cubensis TaxID=181762 RepID=A0ACB8HF09_PSICU|nr:Nuclear exosome regulator NRDE2 [Psilocybe cubensis]KAH9486618.1 Nuclear exosome regulator NRDE2 [Psilocybe cubensis]